MHVKKIPRIGIAVRDLEKAKDFFINVLGATRGIDYGRDETEHIEFIEDEIQEEGLISYYVTLGGLQIELMAPTDEDGHIATFLKKKGEGLMSIVLQVDDLDESIQHMKSNGARIVGEMLDHQLQVGDEKIHTPYCFIHPKDFFGLMVELNIR